MTEVTAYQSEDGKVYPTREQALRADIDQKEKIASDAIRKLLTGVNIGNSRDVAMAMIEKRKDFVEVLVNLGPTNA